MTPGRHEEILLVVEVLERAGEITISTGTLVRLIREVLREYDFVCRTNEALADIESKVDLLVDELRATNEKLREEKANGDRIFGELLEEKKAFAEMRADRDRLLGVPLEAPF